MIPELTYSFYSEDYHGTLEEAQFTAALPKAKARLISITGEDIPERAEEPWLMAFCALIDREGGVDRAGLYSSERVGETTLTYSTAASNKTDLDAIKPYLTGTGLLWSGVPGGRLHP